MSWASVVTAAQAPPNHAASSSVPTQAQYNAAWGGAPGTAGQHAGYSTYTYTQQAPAGGISAAAFNPQQYAQQMQAAHQAAAWQQYYAAVAAQHEQNKRQDQQQQQQQEAYPSSHYQPQQQQQQQQQYSYQQQQPQASTQMPAQNPAVLAQLEKMRQQHAQHTAAQKQANNRFTAARAAAAAAPTPATKKAGAPPELNKWVERCFLSVKSNLKAQETMEKVLTGYVREVAQKGLLWTIDWNNKPLLNVGNAAPSSSSTAPSPRPSSGRKRARSRSPPPSASRYGSRTDWSSGSEEGELHGGSYERGYGSDVEEDGYGNVTHYRGRYGRYDEGFGCDSDGDDDESYYGRGGGRRGGGGGGGGRGGGKQQQKQQQKNLTKKQKKSKNKTYVRERDEDIPLTAEEEEAKRRRQARFDDRRWKPRTVGRSTNVMDHILRGGYGRGGGADDFDFRAVKAIVGTCQELEKEYFRLNEVPDPATVRPEKVLRQALSRLQTRFDTLPDDQASREGYYKEYLWTQFKAIRQDLLIQNLKNAFAVEVYEAHARIALQCSDLNEYNQCQTQLMELYREASLPAAAKAHAHEFTAYRVLYYVYLQSNPKYSDGDSGVLRVLAELTDADKADAAVRHALQVRQAWALGNYHKLSRLYLSAPHLGVRIMVHFMGQARIRALQTMLKAYKPTLSLAFLEAELGFRPEEKQEETPKAFLAKVGLVGKKQPDGGGGGFVYDMKESKVDPAAAVTRTLM